jgi:hypothetical protein
MPSREKLSEFVAWCQKNITGDEKGQAQIFLNRSLSCFCFVLLTFCSLR